MSRAWNSATAMIAANRSLIVVVAGLFVFLPSLVLAIFAPETLSGPETVEDPDQAMAAMTAFYSEHAGWFIASGLVQAIGTLSLFALFGERRPTVGEALATGLKVLLPYILAQILFGFLVALVLGIPVGLAASAGGTGVAVLVGLLALVVFLYLMVKVSFLSPVMVIDRVLNPFAALKRSWQLTKGNSLRLFLFYVLLVVAFVVVAAVVGMVSALVLALLGESAAGVLIAGILNGIVGSVWAVLFVGVLSAAHRQLSGPSAEAVSDTFE